MIHGYDDSTKEKVEVYPKDEAMPVADWALVEGNTTAQPGVVTTVQLDHYTLKAFGINDIRKWMVVSAAQKVATFGIWNPSRYTRVGNISTTIPVATYSEGGSNLNVSLANNSEEAARVDYRILLKRIKD